MDKEAHLAHLRSLIGLEQKTRWEAFGFSPEWSFDLSPLEVEGENAKKYLATFYSSDKKVEREVFVKQYHHPEITGRTVENEFQGLRVAHQAFQESRSFRAPQPYGRLLDEKIIYMERCPTLHLKKTLFEPLRFSRFLLSTRDQETLSSRISEAAELLSAFQQVPAIAHPTDHQKTAEEILLQYERQFLGRLRRCRNLGLPEPLLRRVQEYYLDRIKKVEFCSPQAPRIVLQHSDFAPWNLLVGKDHLYLTDFQNFTTGFFLYDAAFFHTSLGLLSRYRTLDHAFLARLQGLFLQTFLKEKEPSAPLFKIFELAHVAYFAQAILHTHQDSFYGSLYAVPYRRFIIDWFARILEEGDPAPGRTH
jgi:hypothetical protein